MAGMGGEMRCKMCRGRLRGGYCEQCDPAGYRSAKTDYCEVCGGDHAQSECRVAELERRLAENLARLIKYRDLAEDATAGRDEARTRLKRIHEWNTKGCAPNGIRFADLALIYRGGEVSACEPFRNGGPRKCRHCGKTFTPTDSVTPYCSGACAAGQGRKAECA